MNEETDFFQPGLFVRHPAHPEWGTGQVQSAVGHKITVNFSEAGKQVIDARMIALESVAPDAV